MSQRVRSTLLRVVLYIVVVFVMGVRAVLVSHFSDSHLLYAGCSSPLRANARL